MNTPLVLEGAWDRDKLVLMSFPDEAAYRASRQNSPEYLEVSKDRKAGAQGRRAAGERVCAGGLARRRGYRPNGPKPKPNGNGACT